MPHTSASPAWSLEVVRGRDVGKVFTVNGVETVLGNALDGASGLDLREQEGASPRRMAARQAVLESRGVDLTIRDLDSPGGTFVNRRRLLGGQALSLRPGDEIQVGGVLLRVGAAQASAPTSAASPPPLTPGRLPEPFSIRDAVACRNWDDFLVVAAQRWADLRDELASGRLADYLRRIRRLDLLPGADAGLSLDERLDHWLGRLPASRSAAPELDVHPETLEIRAAGGTTRHVLRITNVGYRLLRSTARVEPSGAGWIRILPPHDGRPFATIEATGLTIEVTAPEGPAGRTASEVIIDSNGGTRRVPITIAPPERPPLPESTIEHRPDAARTLAGVSPPARIIVGVAAALAARLLVAASGLMPTGPGMIAMAMLCAAIGGVAGAMGGWRRGRSAADATMAAIAAGLVGVIAAALIHSLAVTIDGPTGDRFGSILMSGPAWAAVGAAVAGATCLIVPYRRPEGETSR